jgi:hypothetical protein
MRKLKTQKTKASPSATPGQVGPAMRGCDILVQALEREGVDTIFAYPGGASMEVHQSLTRSKIRVVLPRHEQGGTFAAEGYAPRHRQGRRLHGHQRPRRHESHHRHR